MKLDRFGKLCLCLMTNELFSFQTVFVSPTRFTDFHVDMFELPTSYIDSLSSNNCINSKRCCKYSTITMPLRDRRAQEKHMQRPGELKPWVFWQSPPTSSAVASRPSHPRTPSPLQTIAGSMTVDPFCTMRIDMHLKSQELFHYCKSLMAEDKLPRRMDFFFVQTASYNPLKISPNRANQEHSLPDGKICRKKTTRRLVRL